MSGVLAWNARSSTLTAMLLALAALLGSTPPVEVQRPHGETPVLALAWTGAESSSSCPSRDALLERIGGQGVASVIGDWVPITYADAKLAANVEVTRDGELWVAELTLTDADGRSTRRFTASSCDALADATALIVAVTLDPIAVSAALEAAQPEPVPELEPVSEPEPLPTRALEPEPSAGIDLVISEAEEPAPQKRWPDGLGFGVSVHGGVSYGPVEAASVLVGGRLAVFRSRWRAELGGRWAVPRRIEVDGAAGSFDAWVVEARGCFAPSVRVFEFPLCPGVEVGSVRGRGVAPTSSPTERGFLWLAPTLSQGFVWTPTERLAIGIEVGLVVAATQGEFVVGTEPITALARVGGRGLGVLEVRLP